MVNAILLFTFTGFIQTQLWRFSLDSWQSHINIREESGLYCGCNCTFTVNKCYIILMLSVSRNTQGVTTPTCSRSKTPLCVLSLSPSCHFTSLCSCFASLLSSAKYAACLVLLIVTRSTPLHLSVNSRSCQPWKSIGPMSVSLSQEGSKKETLTPCAFEELKCLCIICPKLTLPKAHLFLFPLWCCWPQLDAGRISWLL